MGSYGNKVDKFFYAQVLIFCFDILRREHQKFRKIG